MTDNTDLREMTIDELVAEADRIGITDVEDMSIPTLIEIIERERDTNVPESSDAPEPGTDDTSMPGGWENFPG